MEILDFEGLRIGVESKQLLAYGDVHQLRADGRAYFQGDGCREGEEVGGPAAVLFLQYKPQDRTPM
jgi:hypothetical protein